MTTLEIQRRLRAFGHDPGPLDGVRGQRTIAALRAFQVRCGLAADGLAGPATLARLGGGAAEGSAGRMPDDQTRPWYAEAQRLRGLREASGEADNPALLGWARRLGLAYRHDSIAWCGLFVAHCIGATLPDEPLPANPLGARSWLSFGVRCSPAPGAVLVFWRGAAAGWHGHVGFYAGEDATALHVLGGNQGDEVTIARVPRSRLLDMRWPCCAPLPLGGAVTTAAAGALSTNEA